MIARLTLLTLALATVAATRRPGVPAPGEAFAPPGRSVSPGAPVIFEHTTEAGPDQTKRLPE